MNQQQSRKALIGVGIAFVVALASPFALERWNAHQELAGKVQIFEAQSGAPHKAVFECLIKARPGGLVLKFSSTDRYFDPARQVAVRIEDRGNARVVRAWSAPGNELRADERAQLEACLAVR